MEKAGAGVAPPIFLHDNIPSSYSDSALGKKRDYFYHMSVNLQYSGNDWSPNSWKWDSSSFVVRPSGSEVLRPGMRHEENNVKNDSRKQLEWNAGRVGDVEHDQDRLRLNLGGEVNSAEEPASRPSKRTRSGSPGDNYPMCQVDDCKEDLSSVKDYHRRHKVCEVHSKSASALVGKQLQRFCQQCSRFHLLSEFDEGKRSCRRRLAGHNRRRRKTQAEDVNSRVSVQGNQIRGGNVDIDIVHLLQSFACEQSTRILRNRSRSLWDTSAQENFNESLKFPGKWLSGVNREKVADFLGKINSLKLPVDLAVKLQSCQSDNVVTSSGKSPQKHQDRLNSHPLTADLLAAVSSRSSKSKSVDGSVDTLLEKGPAVDQSSAGGDRSSTSYQSLVEDSDGQIQQTPPNLQLQLFISSPEDDSPPKLASSEKYFSSEGSNPVEEWSPSSSPVIQELFPMQSFREAAVSERGMISGEIKGTDDVLMVM